MFSLIAGFVGKKVHNMSYGQRRLVELFRAVAHRPPYLYLDEPFNFLDEENMSKVVPFLQDIAINGTTIVLSNHHQEDLSMIKCADVFKFDGKFPVQSILQVGGKV
jgi:ABC-2 type transport system ATP-binding protein